MSRADIEITIDETTAGRSASVLLNGIEHNNAVTEYTIRHLAGERPTIVTLNTAEPVMFDHGVWRDIADVRLSARTIELIRALGWTHPSDERPTQG